MYKPSCLENSTILHGALCCEPYWLPTPKVLTIPKQMVGFTTEHHNSWWVANRQQLLHLHIFKQWDFPPLTEMKELTSIGPEKCFTGPGRGSFPNDELQLPKKAGYFLRYGRYGSGLVRQAMKVGWTHQASHASQYMSILLI